MDKTLLTNVIREILQNTPHRPFLSLPMAALLYAILKDNHHQKSLLVTGDLLYEDEVIFKQDFSLAKAKHNEFQDWSGHAWVEIDNYICDLSFFRTLYSDAFNKQCKTKLISLFGHGRGAIASPKIELNKMGLRYGTVDYLSDDMATGIIKGFNSLLER